MKLTQNLRTLLVSVCSIALVVVLLSGVRSTVAAHRNADGAVAGIAAAECSQSCADCPLAGTEQCTGCATASGTEQKKPYVDASKCVGCAKCVKVAPEAFEMDKESGKAKIKKDAPAEAIARGAAVCPVSAVVK